MKYDAKVTVMIEMAAALLEPHEILALLGTGGFGDAIVDCAKDMGRL
jgi:D-arabinose 1-dehydrogenase-like Zn-dependent alcohol dehydrogenase